MTDSSTGPTAAPNRPATPLNRRPLPAPGAKGAEPEILARGFREAIGLAIDGDAGVAYVSELGGRIVAVELHPAGEAAAPRVVADLGTPLSAWPA
ncbi:hypothetical protein [Arthrobacter woluwensis]|uniref:hypothetical protein n=1 Tax=Arthrobacter woluwensis TaxID=156980 RepID=UPI000B1FE364|nr:hypothetical protein [Arthrobacter woluwensis]